MTKNRYLLTAGAASMLLVGACGSDDDSGADNAAACDAWIAADDAVIGLLFTGQGDPDSVTAAIDAAIDAADPDIEQTIIDLKAASAEQFANPESSGASDETLALYADTIAWAGDNCDVETIEAAAVDYGFEGVPEELSTGYHVVTFSNEGQEQHEMFAMRFNEGTTETMEELFELSEEEAFSKITPVNAAFAPPGESDTVSWNLAEPGRYAIVCFIPVGSVGETEGDGPPHFTEGMVQEFTVTS
jgi:uncharacterized cupredoxin-like copper-binding protein